MGLRRRDRLDDVDVDSCLANLHRLEAMDPFHVLDLTQSRVPVGLDGVEDDASLAQGYSAMSLGVREENPARGLYESAGFVLVEKHGTSWTMVRHAGRSG